MPQSQQISAKELAADVRSGMTDAQLMVKYLLTPNRLERLLTKLLDLNAITAEDISRRRIPQEKASCPGAKETRLAYRHCVDFVLPIYETETPELLGLVIDLTEAGVGLRGIAARPGDSKNFSIPADEFFEVGRVEFRGLCRWAQEEALGGECVCGFEITSISESSLGELRKLVKLIDTVGSIEATEYIDQPDARQDLRAAETLASILEGSEYADEDAAQGERRTHARQVLPFRLPILEATNRANKGVVLNITEEGIGIEGLESRSGDKRTLVIPAYGFEMFDSIVMVAECRWARKDPFHGKIYTGFRIVHCTSKNAEELARLIVNLMTR